MAIIDQSILDEIKSSGDIIDKRVSNLEAYVFGALSPHITKNAIQYGAGRVVMNANGLFGRDNSSTLGVSSFLLASMAFNANRWSNNQSESLAAGSVMLGSNAANYANMLWDPAAKQLKFRGGTTVQAYIDTNGKIAAGGGNVWMDSNGLFGKDASNVAAFGLLAVAGNANLWGDNVSESLASGSVMLGSNKSTFANMLWDPAAKQLKFRGGTTVQAYIDTSGAITGGGGNVVMDSSGITFVSPTLTTGYIFWKQSIGGTQVAQIASRFSGGNTNYFRIATNNNVANSQIYLVALGGSGGGPSLLLDATTATQTVRFLDDTNTALDYFQVGASAKNASVYIVEKARSVTQSGFRFDAGANTALPQAVEQNDVYFNLNRTEQWTGGGAFTTQRAFLIDAPTYSATIATTITNAATLAISGAPAAGANMTLTNAYALWVQAGKAQFDGAATFAVNPIITNAAPGLVFTDTTAAAKSLTIAVDANLADLRESAGAAGSLLVLDLANNQVGIGTATLGNWVLRLVRSFTATDGTTYASHIDTSGTITAASTKNAHGVVLQPTLTSVSPGAGNVFSGLFVGPTLTKPAVSTTIGNYAGIYVAAPSTTGAGTGTVTLASSIYVAGAPTIGTNNYALYIASGSVFLGGLFTTYNNIATAGYGVPAIVGRVSQTAQTASIASTNFANAGTAGEYIVFGYLYVTTADAAATGNVNFTISWNDGTAARTSTAGAVPFANTSGISESVSKGVVVYIRLGSGSIAWSTTVAPTVGSAQYAIYLTCLRVN